MINKQTIAEKYVHVDNGGYIFRVVLFEEENEIRGTAIEVEDGYYGYSENSMRFREKVTPENLKAIGEMFILASEKLKEASEKTQDLPMVVWDEMGIFPND